MDEPGHILRGDAAIAEEMIDASIDGNDAVEHARLGIGVELNENVFHGAMLG